MDNSRPQNLPESYSLNQAARKLGVSVDTLLSWNDKDILTPQISPLGQISYTKDQLEQFQKAFPVRPSSPESSSKPSGLYQKLIAWIGNGFYEDEFIKQYLNSQIKDSLTYTFKLPSTKVLALAFTVIAVITLAGFTQQHRIKFLFEKINKATNLAMYSSAQTKVLGEQTSKVQLTGNIIFKLPLMAKEDVSIGKNLSVDGTGEFKGDLTAPNIIYDIRAGKNVTVSDAASQRPTISVDLPAMVTSFQGQYGDIVLRAGTDISISGLTINNISTLETVSSRGNCSSCITDADVVDTLTIDSGGSIAGEAIKTGVIAPTVGGTGLTTYVQGDLIYASDTDELVALPIGTTGQFLTTGPSGLPVWDNVGSFAVAVVKEDDIVISSLTNVLDFTSGDFALTVSPVGEVNFALASTLTSVTGVAGNLDIGGGTLSFSAGAAIETSGTGDLIIPTGNVGIGAAPVELDADANPFKLEVAGSIGPDQDGVYDLGSPTRQYRDLYLTGQTTSGGNITIANADPMISLVDTDLGGNRYDIALDLTDFSIANSTTGDVGLLIDAAGNIDLAGGSTDSGCSINNTTGKIVCASLNLTDTTNQITLGPAGNTATVSVASQAAPRTLTIPTLSAADTFVFENHAQTLTNKTIGSTGLTFTGAAIDISTSSNEDLTLTPSGTGQIILSNIVRLLNIPAAPAAATSLCRDDVTNEIVECPANASNTTLQLAYETGNTISATNAEGNIDFTLATGNTTQFLLTNAGTAATAFVINDTNAANQIAFGIQSGGTPTLTINENGTISSLATTNQIILGDTNSVTISSLAPSGDRVATIPALVGDDIFVFGNESQTLTNKTIGSSGLIFSGAATDISTLSNENLTLTPNGTGQVILSSLVQLTTIGAVPVASTALCRDNTTNQIVECPPNASNTTLQLAYEAGNTIGATDTEGDIAFTLASGNTTQFTVTNAGTAASALVINDTNAASQNALEIQTGGTPSLTISESGNLSTTGNLASTATTNQIILGTTNTTTISSLAPAASRTATIPALTANDTFVFLNEIQTLTNKSLSDTSTWFVNASDNSARVAFDLSQISTATTRTITVPDSDGDLCLTSGNCAGTGGVVGGNGTLNRVAKFTVTGSNIGDSNITDNGTIIETLSGVNIGDQTGTDTLTLLRLSDATGGDLTNDSNLLTLQGSYWTGAASANAAFSLQNIITDDSPLSYKLSFQNNSSAEIAALSNAGALSLAATTNQITLGTTNTITIDSIAPSASRTATIPALTASDTFAFLSESQTLTNKTIGSTGLIFSGAATDLSTLSNEDLTLTPNGTGQIILSNITQLDNLPTAPVTATTLCRDDVTHEITECPANAAEISLQLAYEAGNTISATDTYGNIAFTLAAGSTRQFTLANAGTATQAFVINDTNAANQIALAVQSGGTDSLTINENGNLITGGSVSTANIITSGTNEDLTIAPNGTGQIVLSNTVQLDSLPVAPLAATTLCRDNVTHEITECPANAADVTLQLAYNEGNTVVTTTGRNIDFTLAGGLATQTSQTLTNAGTGVAFIINDTNAAANTSLAIQSGGVDSLTISEAGNLSTSGNLTTSGSFIASATTTDITTGTNEDLTLTLNGTGQIILSNIVQLDSLPVAPLAATTLCRDNVTHEITECPANAANVTLQLAYEAGNTISATDAQGHIDFTLAADSTTQFLLTNAGTGASAFVINDTNAANQLALSVQSGGTPTLTINENGNLTTSGNLTTTGTGSIISAGGASITGGINNNNGGITNTGNIGGAGTVSAGAITTSGTLTFTGVATDITTVSNENLTLDTNGTGFIVLDSSTVLSTLPSAPVLATSLCRDDTTGEIVQCPANALNVTLQQAYISGNTISATDTEGNIDFTLAAANARQFTLTNAGTATSAFVINDTAVANQTAFVVQTGGTPTLTINENGNLTTTGTISSQSTTNQIVLGNTNTTTISSIAPAASRYATIPALTADDTFVLLNQSQTLTNKTIGSTGLVFAGATTDITTGSNEDLTITADNAGQIVLNDLVQVSALGANTGSTGLCRNSSNQISTCIPNPDSVTLQLAYDAGNTIGTTNGRNIAFNLTTGLTTSFALTNAGTGNALVINDTNAAANTSLAIQSGGVDSLTINETGNLLTSGNLTTSGSFVASATATDITTGTDEDLTLSPNGTGQIILNTVTQLPNLSATVGATVICRNASNQISVCSSNALNVTLQQAYESGNTISATDAEGNIDFTLAAGNARQLTLTNAGTGTAAIVVNDTNAAGQIALAIQSGSVDSLTINENGNVTSTGLNTTATGINNTAIGATTPSTAAFTTLSSSGNTTLSTGAASTFTAGNSTGATTIQGLTTTISDATNNYININANTGVENVSFGNTATNPTFSFLGTGTATFNGGATVIAGQTLSALGISSFDPDSTNDVTFTTNGVSSSIIINGLDTVIGATLCLDNSNNVVKCSSDSITLQSAYTGGNTIVTTTGRNIDFTLGSGLATQTSLSLTNAGTGNAFVINDTNAASNTSLIIQSAGADSLSIAETGYITSSAFNTTVTGINSTAVGATTPSTAAFTTLSSSGNTTLSTGAASTFTAGNSTGATNLYGSVINLNVADNTPNSLNLVQGTDNYINLNTGNTTENLSFGNTTTNPSFSFLGTGDATFNGGTTFTPDAGSDIVLNTNANSTIIVNGLQTTVGSALCLDSSNNLAYCTGAPFGLQAAYNTGNTIITTDGRNIDFTLGSGLATQTSLSLTNAGTGNAFVINDTNAGTNTSLVISSGGTPALTVNENGNLITSGTLQVTGNTTLSSGAASTFSAGNNTGATTINGSSVNFGNATTNPSFSFLGTGTATFDGGTTFSPDATNDIIFDTNTNSTIVVNGLQTTNGSALCLDSSNNLAYCTGAPFGLQAAYNTGNTIITTEGRDIDFTLGSGLTAQTSLQLTNAGTGNALVIDDTNAATNTSLVISVNGTPSLSISENGYITSSSLNTTATGINNTAIGATTPSTASFTTLSSSGNTSLSTGAAGTFTAGNNTGASIINGSSLSFGNATTNPAASFLGTGIVTFNGGATFTPDATNDIVFNTNANSTIVINDLQTTVGSALCLDSSNNLAYCTGAPFGLQAAYNTGNTIITTDARNIDFTLGSGLATQTSLSLTNAGTGNAFVINDTNGATNTSLAIQSGGVDSLTIT
jgi:hypothetical protein